MTTVDRPVGPATADPARAASPAGGRRPTALVVVAGAWLVLVAVAAVWPSLLATHPPNDVDVVNARAPPSGSHWLGTDQLGRDVYSRLVHGTGVTLLVGVGAVAGAVLLGSLVGVFAAVADRVVSDVVMRLTDVLLAFPGLLLALLVVAVLGTGTLNTLLAIGLASTPGFVRLARSRAVVVQGSGYVQAALVLGRPRREIYLQHVLPNSVPPVLAFALVNIGTAIIAGSSLSFLGLGPEAPTPEWGAMISESRDFLDSAWVMALAPGVAVTLVVLAVNVVGSRLRNRWEMGDAHAAGH